jgi:hypothetical protein
MKTTWPQVVRKALRDEKFLNALIRNPEKALKGFTLTDADKKKLKSLMRRKYTFKGSKLLKILSFYQKGQAAWPPPPWPGKICRPPIKHRPRKK